MGCFTFVKLMMVLFNSLIFVSMFPLWLHAHMWWGGRGGACVCGGLIHCVKSLYENWSCEVKDKQSGDEARGNHLIPPFDANKRRRINISHDWARRAKCNFHVINFKGSNFFCHLRLCFNVEVVLWNGEKLLAALWAERRLASRVHLELPLSHVKLSTRLLIVFLTSPSFLPECRRRRLISQVRRL